MYAYRHMGTCIHTHKCPVLKVSWYSISIVSSISLLNPCILWLSPLLPFDCFDYVVYTLAANVMESLLLNGICVNLIGIYCFWLYVQLRNEILLISSIHYITKLNGQTQSVLSGNRWDSREGKGEFRRSHLKWSLPSHYHFDAFMQRGVSVKTIDISLKGIMARANTAANCQVVGRWQFSVRSSQDTGVVSRTHKQNFAMQPRDWPTTSEEVWRLDENLHATGRPSTAPNGLNEPLHLGSSSANADDLPIWEADVSSNHSETASGHRILVSASSQMS